ncbi:MAG TPA: sigma factor [Candidatus Hydrogenedentes bacterium]|nr:sigma factor [Candidatus Hydrogenedentota bacterium]HRT64811.1 sigma factor [Candidatus Hydrogenedentota bacterium]
MTKANGRDGRRGRGGRRGKPARRIPGAPKQMLLPWRQELTADDLVSIRVAARGLAGRHGYSRSDFEDIAQDLALHVIERMGEYDPGRGAWSTFLKRMLRNKISHLIEYRTFQKRDYRKCIPLQP